jgi:Zn-dependent peptidase ImmA (M78 family)
MRANAFAIELLVPMATLVGTNGSVVAEDRLTEISVEQQVSLHALRAHATNLRNRLAGAG